MSKQIAVVTGCAGFIGLNLIEKLLYDGWNVFGIDAITYVSDTLELERIAKEYPNFHFVGEDIRLINRLPECDVVFNLAAESDVDNSIISVDKFINSNITGVKNLLKIITHDQVVIKHNKPLFFQISTDEVYGDLEDGIFDESAELNPSNPYAATKAAADMLIKSWARTHGLDYIIARPSNNYGMFQYPEKLVPTAVRRLIRGKKIKLHNKGTPVRTWTHVLDTVDALILLYEKAERNRIYNISSEYEQTNYETVRKIINTYFMEKINRDVPNIEEHLDYSYSRPGQDVRYAISCDPLRELGWIPNRDFDKEIVSLVKHYKNKRWIW